MTIKNIEPGDVNIIKFRLGKPYVPGTQTIDLQAQILSLSIYEDIEQPSMVCELTVVDSLNLLSDYPIVGEELLITTFNTPGREKPFHKGFFIYSVEGQGGSPSSKGSIYTLKGVTPIHYFSSGSYIEKSYNTTVDEIVKDIVNTSTVLGKLKKTQLYVEKTKGLVPITIPSLHIFQAVDFVRQKAVSAEYPSGGAFLFFENQYGVQFRSIEGLLAEGKSQIASKTFTYAPDTSSDKQRDQYAFRNIIRYTHLGKFDSVNKSTSGTINNTVTSFDVLTKGVEVTNFNLLEKGKTFTSSDKKGTLPNTNQFLENFNKPAKNFYMPKDSSKGNDFLDANYGSKFAYASLFNENSVRVLVHGDTYLSVGDLIRLELPEMSGTTEKKVSDRLNTGNYLITKLRHIITMEEGGKPKHQIAMDCARMGYK